jgi:hypothetical protein
MIVFFLVFFCGFFIGLLINVAVLAMVALYAAPIAQFLQRVALVLTYKPK